jgi:phasin family protein
MAEQIDTSEALADASAEKAYGAATDTVPIPAETEALADDVAEAGEVAEILQIAPAKAKRATKPKAAPEAVMQAEVVAPAKRRGRPRKDASLAAVAVMPKRAKAAPVIKPVKAAAKVAIKPRKIAKPVAAKPVIAKSVTAKPLAVSVAKPTISRLNLMKDIAMAKTAETAANFTDTVKTAFADAQVKAKVAAKDAYAKGSAVFGEASEFTKGNVEAMVVSGKVLAAGLQGIGTTMAADTKTSVDTITADVKAIAAVKSPTDLVKLQGEIARRNVDSMISYSTKNSEAFLKLANDVFAPISGRFSLAVEKVRKAA